jgi:thiopeptide-type bacteriocin biosynthesis protein
MPRPSSDSLHSGAGSIPAAELLPFALVRVATRSYRWFVECTQAADLSDRVLAAVHGGLLEVSLGTKSPSLLAALQRSRQTGRSLDADAIAALYRYAVRASTRATPLILFAGVATVQVGDFTHLQVPDWSLANVGLHASTPYILAVGQHALSGAETRTGLQLRLEESGLLRGSVFCYFTEQEAEGNKTHIPRYKPVCLRVDKPLRSLLAEPSRRWSWGELSERIHQLMPKAEPAAIDAYLQALVANGVLLHQLQAPTIGQRPELYIAEVVSHQPSLGSLAEQSRALVQLTAQPLPLQGPRMADVWTELAAHPWASGSLPQPDSRPAPDRAGTIGQAVLRLQGLQGGLPRHLLQQLNHCMTATPFLWMQPARPQRARLSDELSQGTVGRRVPLLELVHRVLKVAPAITPSAGKEVGPVAAADPRRQALEAFLRDRLWEADLSAQAVLELDVVAAERALRPQAPFPQPARQMESMLRLLVESGRPTICHYYSTSLLGRLVNRFLHWDDHDPLLHQLRTIWAQQEQALAPAIVAEITSGGGGRVRDISLRPLTYRHQIVVDGAASVPAEWQIHLHELSVYLDNDGPVLFWEKQQVPVIPRQLSALRLTSFSPVVQVLMALDPSPRHWGLTLPESGLPVHTARIAYNDVILCPQTWLLPPSLQSELRKPQREWDTRKLSQQLSAWRERYQVPRIVRLGDMEHNAVDLQGPMALSELASMVEDSLDRVQEEFLHEDALVQGPDGPLVAEAVVYLDLGAGRGQSGTQPASSSRPAIDADDLPPVVPGPALTRGQRESAALRREHVFYPGSPWLYVKLYSGPGLGSEPATRGFLDDDLLGRVIAPLLSELERTAQVADFHFVRYADPEAHLRLRLRPTQQTPMQLLAALAPRLTQEAQAGAFHRYTLDTYEREVDRYGGSMLIERAERLFTADSRLCLRLLGAFHRDRVEQELELRVLLPIYTLHTLLSGFGLDLAAREKFLTQLRSQRLTVEQQPPEQKSALDKKYRRHAGLLQALLRHHEGEADTVPPPLFARRELRAWFADYREAVVQIAPAYRQAEAAGELSVPLFEILASLFHMHCNRLLGNPALESTVVYLAQRSAEALLARRRAHRA